MICDVLRSEFSLRQFCFSNIVFDRVFFSQWRLPNLAIIIYKVILTVYVDYWLVSTAIHYETGRNTDNSFPWPTYLTNWTYTLLALHFTMSTVAIVIYHLIRAWHTKSWLCSRTSSNHWSIMHEGTNQRETTAESYDFEGGAQVIVRSSCAPWYVVVLWILFDMASLAVPMVTLMFFIFLWPQFDKGNGIDMDNLQLHGLNSVVLLIDFVLSPIPVRLLHIIYPIIYGICYVIFSAIYWSGDHTRVLYPGILDWNSPGQTVGMIFVVLAVFCVFQIIFFLLHKVKMYIYYKAHSSDFYECISG